MTEDKLGCGDLNFSAAAAEFSGMTCLKDIERGITAYLEGKRKSEKAEKETRAEEAPRQEEYVGDPLEDVPF